MAFDPKSLTIDYKTLMESTSISDRVAMTKSKQGQQLLSSLDPSDMANIFPDYYKKSNPDVSGFIEATSRRYGRGKDKTPGAEYSEEAKGDNKGGSSWNPGARTGASGSGAGRTSGDYTPSVLSRLKEATKEDFTPTSSKGRGIDRSRFSGDMQNDETRMRMYALAISEVGASADPSSKMSIMETMFNRTDAQKRGSISATMARSDNPKNNYYAPYDNGAFDKNLARLRRDPKLVAEMDAHLKEVLSGSNEANYATDNASGTVAANAMYTQSFQGKTGSGEFLFIKDKDDPASIKQHGAAVVRNNKEFRARSEAQVAEYARKKQQNIEVAEDPKANKVLPDNINKEIRQYYDSKDLTQAQRDQFAIKLNKVMASSFDGDVNRLNSDFEKTHKVPVPGKGYVNINPDRIIADVMQGKISPEDSMVSTAMSMKGINEKTQRNELMEFFKSNRTSSVDPSVQPWCAAFVNSSLANVGIKGTGSAAAGSFHQWGDTVSSQENPNPGNIKKGDVFVNYRQSKDTGMTGSHAGIVTGPAFQGKDGHWYVKTISGNTGDTVGDTVGEQTIRVDSNRFGRAAKTEQYFDKTVLDTVTKAKKKEVEPVTPPPTTASTAQTAPRPLNSFSVNNATISKYLDANPTEVTKYDPNASWKNGIITTAMSEKQLREAVVKHAPPQHANMINESIVAAPEAREPRGEVKAFALGGEVRGIEDPSKLKAQSLAKEIRTSGGKENVRLSYDGKDVADVNNKESMLLNKDRNTLSIIPESRGNASEIKKQPADNTESVAAVQPQPQQQYAQNNRPPDPPADRHGAPAAVAPIGYISTAAYERVVEGGLNQGHHGYGSLNGVA